MKPETKDGIDRFAREGCPVGDFLYAVLTNNLKDAFGRADGDNKQDLEEIVRYCYWEIPANCWGSEEKVEAWLDEHAKRRRAAQGQ